MPSLFRKSAISLIVITTLLLAAAALSGCGEETATTGASSKTSEKQSSDSDKESSKVLTVGDTCATEKAEVTVKKVGTTANLDSPEASALLETGEPGEQESNYGAKGTPAAGNEFLMVTLNFKNINAKPPVVNPSSIKLQNGEDKEYQEVSTGGYGGVYNMLQVDPGKERQVTAVYEVPKGETGLTLTYKPYGEVACLFKVR